MGERSAMIIVKSSKVKSGLLDFFSFFFCENKEKCQNDKKILILGAFSRKNACNYVKKWYNN